MFENLMVIVIIVVILWLIGFAIYLYASRQQQDLTAQMDNLKRQLDRKDDAEN
jgi:hypothetical protein